MFFDYGFLEIKKNAKKQQKKQFRDETALFATYFTSF